MNRLNFLFTLSSLSVVLVTIERFSATTKVLLQPNSFMRLHEILQMTFLITLTVIIPLLIVKEITNNFDTLKIKKAFGFFLLFVLGVYFYATGNGIHEVSSFNFNQYCDVYNFTGDLCGGFFTNDYYTGNIFYFFGGALMVISTLLLERLRPSNKFNSSQMAILVINAVIYALAIFAYAAFDRVNVGIIYSVVVTIIADIFFLSIRLKLAQYPITTYTAATYTLGTTAALLVRFVLR